MHTIWKHVGETPLEALERFRFEAVNGASEPGEKRRLGTAPMTYAGRLDPLAEGLLIVLVGDECKLKDKFLGLDKEYEIEVVLGIETDSYDALGIPAKEHRVPGHEDIASVDLTKYVGEFVQEYPPFSSKTVGGKPLHSLARAGKLPDEMPRKQVEIRSIKLLNIDFISGRDLLGRIRSAVGKVMGDFRQDEIMTAWQNLLGTERGKIGLSDGFQVVSLRVSCSSGTYMRSLAHRMGEDLGSSAFALSIKRTRIGRFDSQ